jgi:hypothetical protein
MVKAYQNSKKKLFKVINLQQLDPIKEWFNNKLEITILLLEEYQLCVRVMQIWNQFYLFQIYIIQVIHNNMV